MKCYPRAHHTISFFCDIKLASEERNVHYIVNIKPWMLKVVAMVATRRYTAVQCLPRGWSVRCTGRSSVYYQRIKRTSRKVRFHVARNWVAAAAMTYGTGRYLMNVIASTPPSVALICYTYFPRSFLRPSFVTRCSYGVISHHVCCQSINQSYGKIGYRVTTRIVTRLGHKPSSTL